MKKILLPAFALLLLLSGCSLDSAAKTTGKTVKVMLPEKDVSSAIEEYVSSPEVEAAGQDFLRQAAEMNAPGRDLNAAAAEYKNNINAKQYSDIPENIRAEIEKNPNVKQAVINSFNK